MKVFLSLGFMLTTLLLHAAQDFVPLQEKAQGQALTGAVQLNESLYSNPAASSLVNVYSIDGSLSLPKSFAVSVLDTKTSGLGGAIGYFKREADKDYFAPGVTSNPGANTIQGAKLALMSRLSNNLGVGISGKSIWGPNIQGKADRIQDLDLGVIYNQGFFQLGASFRNILGGKELMQFYREYALGGRISYNQILSLSVATQSKLNKSTPYQVGVGVEYVSPYYFALRGGYRNLLQERKNFWSLGGSFVSPKLSLHYAMEIPNQPNASLEHTLGTTLLF